MGYRSDVRVRMREQDYNVLKANIVNNEELEDYIVNWGKVINSKKIGNDTFVLIEWEDIKWYDSYEHIDYIMTYLQTLPVYAFCRIGETSGDISTKYRNKGNLYDGFALEIFTKTIFDNCNEKVEDE